MTNFIQAFRHNPKALIGITKAHTVVHAINWIEKHGLVILALPLVTLAMILASFQVTVLLSLLICASVYLLNLRDSGRGIGDVACYTI